MRHQHGEAAQRTVRCRLLDGPTVEDSRESLAPGSQTRRPGLLPRLAAHPTRHSRQAQDTGLCQDVRSFASRWNQGAQHLAASRLLGGVLPLRIGLRLCHVHTPYRTSPSGVAPHTTGPAVLPVVCVFR